MELPLTPLAETTKSEHRDEFQLDWAGWLAGFSLTASAHDCDYPHPPSSVPISYTRPEQASPQATKFQCNKTSRSAPVYSLWLAGFPPTLVRSVWAFFFRECFVGRRRRRAKLLDLLQKQNKCLTVLLGKQWSWASFSRCR